MKIELNLTEQQSSALVAAVSEHYHKLKDNALDTTFGGLITDERVLGARDIWRQVEDQVNLGSWD